ncbi:hypothetical protein SAMN05444162_3452 [Paenibacillaceae bacterium GAS479]|nr:hypothetical protein SAMN05444162_3452 [Paenibacillaceae bacterium GAS479]
MRRQHGRRSEVPDVTIQSTDIRKGFSRPSLFVQLENSTVSPLNPKAIQRSLQITIYFFPSDPYDNQIELLDTQDSLEMAFSNHLEIEEGMKLSLFEVSSVKVDGVLQVSFELEYINIDVSEEAGETMEEINITYNKGDC